MKTSAKRPDIQTLVRLAWVLKLPIDFFRSREQLSFDFCGCYKTGVKPISIEECHFRSLRSATQTERRRVLAWGVLGLELCKTLEEVYHFEFPKDVTELVSTPVRNLSEGGQEDIERLSLEVRRRWMGDKHLYSPVGSSIVHLLENNGILFFQLPRHLHSEKVDAFSVRLEGRGCIFLNTAKPNSRIIFDAAHELGHLLMHRDDVNPGDIELERQADAFASAFLLPAKAMQAEFPRRIDWRVLGKLKELKTKWKTSLAALVRRGYDLQIISETTYRRAFTHFNKTKIRYNEPNEPSLQNSNLIQRAIQQLADDGLSLDSIAEQLTIKVDDLNELVWSQNHQVRTSSPKPNKMPDNPYTERVVYGTWERQ